MRWNGWTGRHLAVRAPRGVPVHGVVLVMHGGRVRSTEPVSAWQLAVLRVGALARSVRAQVAPHGLAVATLRFSVRGWNGHEESPLADARWALGELDARFGLPVGLIGHSMGGRTAVRVAGHPSVRGVVALAPWLPAGEPVEQLAGRRLFVAHGTDDRITDPRLSELFALRAEPVAEQVVYDSVGGDGHGMLRRSGYWHRFAAGAALEVLGVAGGDRR